ncbi:MAG: DNA-processing protein DprA [Betaproteobacteria bacterium]|nr:DNA-processing protein DprA [Betaproteobacteria bacterium]
MPVGSNTIGWLAAAFAPGITDRIRRVLADAGGPELDWPSRTAIAAARLAGAQGGRARGGNPPDLARALQLGGADPRVALALGWLAEPGHHLLSLDDPAYPCLLQEIDDPPVLLYVAGRLDLLQRPALAMVGSRNPSALGAQTAEGFARGFSEAGLTVVSGLALGIDAAAHRGALGGAGSTVAVVGTGLDIVYPARNRDLAHRIALEGALVSEFPLGMTARADHFPRRNRILSGLALGCLVVEANLRSGSLITARLATEQGREVFAVPGSIHSPMARGCHLLIRQGAKLTESTADVIEELGWARAPATVPDTHEAAHRAATDRAGAGAGAGSPTGSGQVPPLDADPQAMLAVVTHEPVSADTLCMVLGWTPQRVNAALVELELAARIAPAGHGLFQRLADPGFEFARGG